MFTFYSVSVRRFFGSFERGSKGEGGGGGVTRKILSFKWTAGMRRTVMERR